MAKHLLVKRATLALGVFVLLLVTASFLPKNARSQPGQPRGRDVLTGEVLIAQFANGSHAVTTRHEYSGTVTLTVSGIGQASSTSYSDAFYILTDYSGNPIDPVHTQEFVFSINGHLPEDLIPGHQVPAYRPDHVYTFEIDAPGGTLFMGVSDGFTADNTGSYVITVEGSTLCTVPYFSQRDPRWIDHPLGTNGGCSASCSTIGACGCTLTAAAMTFAYYGAGLTPATLSDCLGTDACPFSWSTGASCTGGDASWIGRYEFTWDRLDQELNQNGRPVILGLHRSDDPNDTHWVVATSGQGNSPGNYLIHDPWPVNGAETNLAVYTRQDYILDYISVYDGEPFCNAVTQDARESLSSPIQDTWPVTGSQGPDGESMLATDSDATPDIISGMVRIYHLELTAVIIQLSAVSTAGAVTDMQIWTDSGSAPAWQPFSTLAWLPWQPGDMVHARFRDAAGNVSGDTSDSIQPDFSPDPLPILTPTPTPTPTATPSAPARTVFMPLVGRSELISRFMALCSNENANTGGITRAAIRSQGNTIYVHMWGKCTPTDCDWGETTTTTVDALDGTLNLTWTRPYKVETQQVSVLDDGRLRVAGHVVYNDGRPPRDYVEIFAPPTSQDIAYAAIRLENLELNQSVYSVGDVILTSAQFANRSLHTLQLVVSPPFNYCTIGVQQQWIERLGPDPSIPPFDDAGIFFDGRRYAAGGAVLAVPSCALAPNATRDAYNTRNGTTGFPVGNYRFYMEYETLNDLVLQSEVVPFEVISAVELYPR